MNLAPPTADLSDDAVYAMAIAMRDVARADGEHPRELALIAELTDGVEIGEGPADLSTLQGAAEQEVFLKSLVLVALADGEVSSEEGTVIQDYASKLGLGDREVARCITEVASVMLSRLRGVTAFRADVVAIGERMGLDSFSILHALEGS